MHDYLPIVERDTFYTCASGGLGHGLPAAVGVALARPRREGDRAARRRLEHVRDPGLWTAAQLGLPITFVIVNNGATRRSSNSAGISGCSARSAPACPISTSALWRGPGRRGNRVDTPRRARRRVAHRLCHHCAADLGGGRRRLRADERTLFAAEASDAIGHRLPGSPEQLKVNCSQTHAATLVAIRSSFRRGARRRLGRNSRDLEQGVNCRWWD